MLYYPSVDEWLREPFIPPKLTIHSAPQGQSWRRLSKDFNLLANWTKPLVLVQDIEFLEQCTLCLCFRDHLVFVLEGSSDVCNNSVIYMAQYK